jgi:hypothetical protein
MFDLNGPLPPLKQTSRLSRLLNAASVMWTWLRLLQPPVKLAFVLIALVLVTLLSGCATQSPPSVAPTNPQPPQISEPLPQNSYSSKALRLIESWRERLMGTPPM